MKKRAGCVVGLGLVEMEIEGMGMGEIILEKLECCYFERAQCGTLVQQQPAGIFR